MKVHVAEAWGDAYAWVDARFPSPTLKSLTPDKIRCMLADAYAAGQASDVRRPAIYPNAAHDGKQA